jgi:TonB family protein
MRRQIFLKLSATVAIAAHLMLAQASSGSWVPEEIFGLSYPRIARAASVSGLVVVEFKIKPDGVVAEAIAVSGPRILQFAAIQAAKRWRFKPSRLHNPAFRANFEFRLEGSCKTQCCAENLVIHYPDRVTLTAEFLEIQPSKSVP